MSESPRKGTPRPGNGGPRPNAGGARSGAGRKPSELELELERVMVMLTPEQIAQARQLGGGGQRDLSKGIRRALESCKT